MRKQHIPLLLGIVILSLFLTAALFPTVFTAYGQKETFGPWLMPSAEHLLGTNALGYDIFTELVYGTRQTLLVGVSSSILTLLLGSVIGTLAAGKGRAGDFSGKLQPKSDPSDCCIQLGGDGPECPCQGHSPECPAFY